MAQTQEVRIPDIGDFDAVSVVEVLVAPGDKVEVDQPLITLESDKASMEVPSSHAGTVESVAVAVGDEVGEGAVIATLTLDEGAEAGDQSDQSESDKSDKSDKSDDEKAAEEKAAEEKADDEKAAEEKADDEKAAEESTPAPAPEAPVDEAAFGDAYASPAVRRLARELEVDLGRIEGSGRKGRITKDDLHAYVKQAMRGGAAGAAAGTGRGAAVSGFEWPQMPAIDFAKFGPVEERPLSRIRKLSAANLHRSWLHVPHVTQHEEADVTELEAFRKAEGARTKDQGVKLTPVAFLLKAAAGALAAFPEFNASLAPGGETLIVKRYIHIGVAVDTPDGLVVPVIRDVDKKGLVALAEELGAVSGRARDKKLKPADLQGASFTISSLGGIGGTAFTPIVNAPEVAILGVSRMRQAPVWDGAAFVPRLMLPLSLSYDHRVIDGAMAARFIVHLGGLLGDIRRLLL